MRFSFDSRAGSAALAGMGGGTVDLSHLLKRGVGRHRKGDFHAFIAADLRQAQVGESRSHSPGSVWSGGVMEYWSF